MTIFAIDPGPTQTAWIEFHLRGTPPDNIKIIDMGIDLNDAFFHKLRSYVKRSWADDPPSVVIEMIANMGMPAGKSLFETCVTIGRVVEIVASEGWETCRMFRSAIKLAICGDSRAKDGNVRQALIDRFGETGTKKNQGDLYGVKTHLWQALASGVAWHEINERA